MLTAVLVNLANANTGTNVNCTEGALDDGLPGAARDRHNKGERPAKHQRPRDSKIIVTTALSMLCYARNDLSNALQA